MRENQHPQCGTAAAVIITPLGCFCSEALRVEEKEEADERRSLTLSTGQKIHCETPPTHHEAANTRRGDDQTSDLLLKPPVEHSGTGNVKTVSSLTTSDSERIVDLCVTERLLIAASY